MCENLYSDMKRKIHEKIQLNNFGQPFCLMQNLKI